MQRQALILHDSASMPSTPEASEEWPSLDDVERAHIVRTLAYVGGNISAAADLLGLYRSSLQRRLRRYGLR